MRPSPVLLLIAALGLSACQTPREACVAEASEQLRTIEMLIAETRGNIDRGYGLETRQDVDVVPDWCAVRNADGTEGRVRCDRTEVRDIERPVALDLEAERAKLDSLLEQRGRLLGQQEARLAACRAAYPE